MRKPISGIYIIVNTQTNKIYIGKANDIYRRWREHKSSLRRGLHGNRYLQRAWNKYGENVFKFKKLEHCPVEALDEREQHYLDVYLAKGICYNIAIDSVGGMTGRHHTDETRRKISTILAGKTRRPLSEETKRKIGDANRGKRRSPETCLKLSEKAKNCSPETRRKMSEAHLGKKNPPHSAETKQKMSDAAKGRVCSEETRKKMSEAQKTRVRHPLSEETRRKIGEANKRAYELKKLTSVTLDNP